MKRKFLKREIDGVEEDEKDRKKREYEKEMERKKRESMRKRTGRASFYHREESMEMMKETSEKEMVEENRSTRQEEAHLRGFFHIVREKGEREREEDDLVLSPWFNGP